MKLLQNKIKISRRVSVLITFLGFVLFIGLSGYFITTKVITEAIKLVENAPMYINEITKAWLRAETDFSNAAKDLPKDLVDEISNQIQAFLNKTKNDLVAYVNIMSIIIWIIDFIPIIGSIVILGPWALFHLLTGDLAMGTQLAILAAVLLIIRRTVGLR